jgi:hypothetical protein
VRAALRRTRDIQHFEIVLMLLVSAASQRTPGTWTDDDRERLDELSRNAGR